MFKIYITCYIYNGLTIDSKWIKYVSNLSVLIFNMVNTDNRVQINKNSQCSWMWRHLETKSLKMATLKDKTSTEQLLSHYLLSFNSKCLLVLLYECWFFST